MMTKLTTIYLVRHGETDWNVQNLLQGQTDIHLNKKGIKQSQEFAKKVKKVKFDAVFSSDLVRARRTAEIITLDRKLAIETRKVLRERFFGKYEGMPRREFYKLFTNWEKLSEKEKFRFKLSEDIESEEEAAIRLITFLREVAVGYAGMTILIVAHGGLMKALLIHLGYATAEKPVRMKNNGFILLESDGVDFFIKEVNGGEKNV
ncbi:hypothetical protein A3A93_03025 [Candidatus Roizmanbacteria bacterium RIFCSPLOWO2_01_FULL_38_12]|uniref:Phosphoglycerate mutase n=1 Tax=Candidatus Roizmanbacteria bacterium RIFCSPLOWO2_01_FULL_38_12 TaxID=1802061 RepID=A0A1F7IZI4_9BACT|nr:MAG: hypothetical protein A3A93_03025 [Candidatus Roizmanbacteria bacterium RIFCSPLOWO2_01_FULL_38_12]